ncbi:MAG: 5'/3'-nucleotidase SurE [Desulfosarcinaceae bacterium]|nr:5'/3'-nucleotidase SurE [Desulfosarcinaceae bacterium]
MKIVITNDDGYGEPGLEALWEAVASLGEVVVVAPEAPHSACGHQVTLWSPIKASQPRPDHYLVQGTPVDCARLALKVFAPDADWLIAGINPGANLGSDLYQSGTVAAAREAAILGKPSLAISQYIGRDCPLDWTATGAVAGAVIADVVQQPTPAGCYWNINLPCGPNPAHPPERQRAPADKHPHDFRYVVEGDRYRLDGVIHDRPRAKGSDVDVCFSGRISITQLEI